MKLDFIPLSQLTISKANMRYAVRGPDVSDILPTVRRRGVIVPVLVRPATTSGDAGAPTFEIVAGARRFTAARLVAEEKGEDMGAADPLPCAILDDGDDADAIEASLIENTARRDPDEVTQWETYTRLVKEGRDPADIAATFALPDLAVKRILALGNLMPRVRDLYRKEEIDAATVRHLTLASKSQQRAWLALFDDGEAWCPIGHQLKAWLLGGQSVSTANALFDVEASGLAVVADLFGEERYFADAQGFWAAQETALAARREAYLEEGWPDVVIVPRGDYFHLWEYSKAPKRKGGRVYADVQGNGEVIFHEGYVTSREARRLEKGEAIESAARPSRPEVTSTLQAYVDLHRHAALRAAMTGHPALALRLMVAHVIAGSALWHVRVEPQTSRSDAVRESVENCEGEALFDAKRRAVLDLLGFSPEEPTVTGGVGGTWGDDLGLAHLFLRLLPLTDEALGQVIAIAMGETLAAGSAAVEAVGSEIGLDMALYWQADEAFFEALRDREVLIAMVAEVAGADIAEANAREKGSTLKRILADHIEGANGRSKTERWVPRWMVFPPSGYTARSGVGSVAAHARLQAARDRALDGEPPVSEPNEAEDVTKLAVADGDDALAEPDRQAA